MFKRFGIGVAVLFMLSLLVPMQSAAALASWPVVRNGDRGDNVQAMQYVLRHRSYSLTADAVFGSGTE